MQLYLRAGDYATAFKVLKQMELKGIPADISTHTMLITAAFDNNTLDDLSEADQASRLIQMFDELEAGGLRLNNYVYATAVDRLLKQYGSHNAVRTIIDHMRSKNLAPSAHVYTSLVTYYFQQSPPAIEAVDTLLHQIFESAHSDTDKYLFDRTIEGYAEHGEVGKMMSVLTRMSKQGQHPGFQALTAVIRALVEAGDVDRARFIVRDVERGEGVAYGGVTGRIDSQRQFLQVAQSLGVGLNDERMGDMFKMRSEASVLDEQNKIRAREERERSPGSKSGGDVGPPEENIHGFLEDEPRR
jgi:pentatricopeptide repeat protein